MRRSAIITHFAAAAIVTVLAALIYVSVQQSYRSAANDPQLQIARDFREKFSPLEYNITDTIDIAHSLSIFLIVYDKTGTPTFSTALLDGKIPKLPSGVFESTKKNGEDVLSWQPRRGVRMAMVVESLQSSEEGFVAVGRSLEEVEKREANLATMLLIGWLLCLGILVFHWLIVFFQERR